MQRRPSVPRLAQGALARARGGAGLLALLGALAGCAEEPAGARSLILLSLDTLRADHLSAYGYPRPTSPQLDAFAASATLYTRAMASAPWTLPSHASLFTGLDPFEHGAHSFRASGPGENAWALAPEHRTLAEALAEEGFATAAFVANSSYLTPRTGLDQGFATFEVKRERAREKNRRVLAWLEQQRGRRFFLFVNTMDTHPPYNLERWPPWLGSPPNRSPALARRLYEVVMPGDAPPPADLVRQVVDQYDASIANLDDALGELFAGIAALGLLDEALIAVTSDHGEYLGEHRLLWHSKDVHQPVLWVPLILRAPGQRAGRRVETPLSSAHVPHLIAGAFEPALAARLQVLFPRAAGADPVLAENYYTRARDLLDPRWGWRFDRVRRAFYEWPWKYVESSDGQHELYDLAADPGEERNRIRERPERARELASRLAARLERAPGAGTGPRLADPDAAELEELRALGYAP